MGPRVTEDVDVFAPLDQALAIPIIKAYADLRPRWRMRPELPIITPDSSNLFNIKNMYLRTDVGQIDILGEVPGVGTFEELLARATDVPFGGVLCPVIDLDSLLTAKRIAGRAKDRPAIEELEFLRDLKRRKQGGDAASGLR